jgi:hypothetical protein
MLSTRRRSAGCPGRHLPNTFDVGLISTGCGKRRWSTARIVSDVPCAARILTAQPDAAVPRC